MILVEPWEAIVDGSWRSEPALRLYVMETRRSLRSDRVFGGV